MKNIKKIVTSLLILGLVLAYSGQVPAIGSTEIESNASIKVYFEGELIDYHVEPIINNCCTMVPLRTTANALGYDVIWYEGRGFVSVIKDDKIIDFHRNGVVWVNGKDKESCQSTIVNGSTMVPLRFLAEALGYQVKWNQYTRTINIYEASSITTSDDLIKSDDKSDLMYGAQLKYLEEIFKKKGTITSEDLEKI